MILIYCGGGEDYRYWIIGIGILEGIFILYVCYTERGERIRVYSARKARPREEERYYEQFDS